MKKKPPRQSLPPVSPVAIEHLTLTMTKLGQQIADLTSIIEKRLEGPSWESIHEQHTKRDADRHAHHMRLMSARAELYAVLKAQIQAELPPGRGQ